MRATELVQEPENLTQDIDDKEELGGRKNLLIDIPEVTFEKETNSIGAEENNTVCGHAGDGDLPTAVVELQESLADASAEADRVCEVTEYIQVNETNTQDLPQERSTQCELDLHPAHHVTETPAGTPATEEGIIFYQAFVKELILFKSNCKEYDDDAELALILLPN